MKKLNKYSVPLLLVMILSLSSCKKFLDEKVYSQQFPENFYTNPAEAEGAIRGIMDFEATLPLIALQDYMTDNVTIDASHLLRNDQFYQFAEKNVKSTNDIFERVYENFYRSIYNANAFISNMEKSTWKTNADKQKQYIAEVYTLRAMSYFYLVRLFGKVPLIIDVKDNTPVGPRNIGRTDISSIYQQIIKDLQTAKSLFLQEEPRAPGWPGKIMARLLLAEVYLTMHGKPLELGDDYLRLARAEADTLIHAKANGIVVPELVNFNTVFTVANENRGEIIFSRQNYGIGTGPIGSTTKFSYGALSFDLLREFNTSGPIDMNSPGRDIRGVDPNSAAYDLTMYPDTSSFIDGRFYPTFWPYENSWDADTKKLAKFRDPLLYLKDPSRYSFNGTANGVKYNSNRTVFPGKYKSDYPFKGGANAPYAHYEKAPNSIFLRWAQAFLIYAEADNELSGPQPEAIEAVNKIRHRAGLLDLPANRISGKEVFREAIRKEWRLEFVFEGRHIYNLQRWGTLIDDVNSFANEYNGFNPNGLQMKLLQQGKNEIFPIPFREIDASGFEQNPNY